MPPPQTRSWSRRAQKLSSLDPGSTTATATNPTPTKVPETASGGPQMHSKTSTPGSLDPPVATSSSVTLPPTSPAAVPEHDGHKCKHGLQDSCDNLSKMRRALDHLEALKEELEGLEEMKDEFLAHIIAMEKILKGSKKLHEQGSHMILNAILLTLAEVTSTQTQCIAIVPEMMIARKDGVLVSPSHQAVSVDELWLTGKVDYAVIEYKDSINSDEKDCLLRPAKRQGQELTSVSCIPEAIHL
ncbi:hypothetical protein OG21DRAFT_1527796 [Imleria badia]|nr:hypothetical protein OG21DRAFT_1527796 [Imleria badia]